MKENLGNTCFIWHIMDQAQKLGDHILYVYEIN
jgi:hypothetical protein